MRGWTALIAVVLTGACIPYTVGNTAVPLGPEERQVSMSWYFIPSGIEGTDSSGHGYMGVDAEARVGLPNNYSDFGIRLPAFSGIVLTYKARIGADAKAPGPAFAVQLGGGIVNWADHAYGEITFLASAPDGRSLTPYGAARVMHVWPISSGAVTDKPSIGGAVGLRIGSRDFGVSPELAIYHDPSALHLRSRDVIFVPSITLHGEELLNLIGRLFPRR